MEALLFLGIGFPLVVGVMLWDIYGRQREPEDPLFVRLWAGLNDDITEEEWALIARNSLERDSI